MFWTHVQRSQCPLTVRVPQTRSLRRNTGEGSLFKLSCVSLPPPNDKLPWAWLREEADWGGTKFNPQQFCARGLLIT